MAAREAKPLSVILEARHLVRAVGSKIIVNDFSFDVNVGELLAIVGPSGAGKSSLLRLLNRLDEPTSGAVFLEGRDYREIPTRELRRQIGMVMQRPFVFPGTVAENLRFGPQQQGKILSDEDVEVLLKGVGLSGYVREDVGHLSGGEAQRVCFARALANQPKVLLLDEPTSALDESAKFEVEAVIRKIAQGGVTSVLVTHDLRQARRLASRVAQLEAGKLIRIGSVSEVLNVETSFSE
ncbi:MAG TPA: phosphate ABC transporter ATP-binding protein [Terriglobales bacterium]|nr:phosphate ABC transporter ATP-binding protein [Terriglobales bacterium]